jgi:F0F1-type ATP synthase assembly protein I
MCRGRAGREGPLVIQKHDGFGDGLAQAVEMAASPMILTLLGLAVDRRLGTVPLFTIVMLVVGMAGAFARAFYTYEHQCRLEEERRPWGGPAR